MISFSNYTYPTFNSLARFLNNNHDKVRNVIAFFVGPVKIRMMRVPIDTIIKEHLEYLGWSHEATLVDTIVARRLFKVDVNPATGLEDKRTPNRTPINNEERAYYQIS